MTHSVVVNSVILTLAASAIPLLALCLYLLNVIGDTKEMFRKLKRRYVAERRNLRNTEQKLTRFKARHRLALRRAVYYRHLRWSEKRQKQESREQLVTTEVKLATEQERGSIRSFLVSLLNRTIAFGPQTA
jgi:Na+-translocating ferredoxin:NAD+ oxidoreductase RnfC subunit